MKIIVLDIETTGFNAYKDAIVEIGMVLVDTNTKKIEIIFNEVVKHDRFDEEAHKKAWIFLNSSLKVEDVLNAKNLEYYRPKIQEYLDKYGMTAFNMKFDTRFLEANGFTLKKTKCLMESSKKYNVNRDKRGGIKTPSVPEIYNQFFPDAKYDEEHRGCDDALHEAQILLKLCELKIEETNKQLNENESTTNS